MTLMTDEETVADIKRRLIESDWGTMRQWPNDEDDKGGLVHEFTLSGHPHVLFFKDNPDIADRGFAPDMTYVIYDEPRWCGGARVICTDSQLEFVAQLVEYARLIKGAPRRTPARFIPATKGKPSEFQRGKRKRYDAWLKEHWPRADVYE